MNPTTQPIIPLQSQQPPPLLPQQQQQQQQPLLQPHRPSTSCDRHPQETFTGFCPSCLCERLAVLDPNNNTASSSARKPPTSSTAAAALKAIFRPSSSTTSRNTTTNNNNNNRPPTTSTSFLPELRRTKSFSASKNEGFSGTFEPQRRSCDVRGRSTLFSLFNQDDDRKIPKPEPPRLPEPLPSSSIVQKPVIIESLQHEEVVVEEEYEDNIIVEEEEDYNEDEIRVLEEPEREILNVVEDRVQEIIEEEPELELEREPEPEPEVSVITEESFKPMKEHMDLDSQTKKTSSGRDLKGSFWSAASVFSKKLQKWRQKQKAKKRGGPRNGTVSGSSHLLPVEKPIGRQFRETQSEIADYGFGRRSCDTDPRFSLDIARMSFDNDPRYSFDEPRASWDGYLVGKTFPRMPLPSSMLSVVEDAPVHVLRTDSLIPVEDPTPDEIVINMPGNSTQTKEYYTDSSTRRRKSLDRSNSIRKTAAAVVAEMDELKPVSNAKVTPAIATAAADCLLAPKVDRDLNLRDSNSNSNSITSLRDDCSESFELGFRDNASVVASNGDRKGSAKKSSSRWSKAWSIWGFINRRGGNNKEEDEDRYSRGGNGNGVERSYSESWQEFRGERNGDVRGVGNGGVGGGLNRKILRSNSSVSWRNAPGIGIGGSISGRKSDVQANGFHGRKSRDEFVLERNRSARYSPNNMDNGLLRLYLTPGGRRNGSTKGRSNQAHSIARSVLRLY